MLLSSLFAIFATLVLTGMARPLAAPAPARRTDNDLKSRAPR